MLITTMYSFTSPSMDAMKQKWINELAKYDFSLEYQKGVADALSRIKEGWLSNEEADKLVDSVSMIPGDEGHFF